MIKKNNKLIIDLNSEATLHTVKEDNKINPNSSTEDMQRCIN
jgi:hypothetical protein